MSTKFSTEQEFFWAGKFGDEYVSRNNKPESISWRTAVFSKILSRTQGINTVLEIGANIGHNLFAIRNLLPSCKFSAIEINQTAIKELELIPNTKVFRGSVFDFTPSELGLYDLTFTSGVLIHIDPHKLHEVYGILYNCSKKYILVREYYNPTFVEVNYRGHSQKLFKRDFAGEMMDIYSDLELIDYGFQYHRDYNFPADDSTWFLLKKTN
jgi:spore coat polysaccharide biosynthesis protein SpsF